MNFDAIREQTEKLFMKLHDAHVEYLRLWADHILLTWRWWIALSMIVVPWAIWLIIRKRDSTDRLLYAGLLAILLSSFLDMLGVVLGLWSYPTSVFPLMPSYIPFDCSAMPVATMVFIQFRPKVKTIYKSLVYAGFGAFVFEPLMHWIGLYTKQGWKSYYSFPILLGIYLLCNYISKKKNFAPVA